MQTQTQSPKIGRRRGGGCGDSAVEEAAAAADTDMQVITLLFISYMVVRPSVRPSIPDLPRGEEGDESVTDMVTQTEKVRL